MPNNLKVFGNKKTGENRKSLPMSEEENRRIKIGKVYLCLKKKTGESKEEKFTYV